MRLDAPTSWRIDATALALLGGGSALVYLGGWLRFPLREIYSQRIMNLTKLTDAAPLTGLFMAICVLTLFAVYAVGLRLLLRQGGSPSRVAKLLILVFPLLFGYLLLWTYPFTSIDLYDYAFRGRMLVHFQANTFLEVPRDFSSDPLFWYVAWRRAVTAYGPLWEGLSWLTAYAAGQRPGPVLMTTGQPANLEQAALIVALLRLLVAYKLLAGLGYLLCGLSLAGALGTIDPRWRWPGLYLWFWNPLVLWESIGAGHNDAWMALFIVLALWVFSIDVPRLWSATDRHTHQIGSAVAAFVALTLGALIKYLALLFGPALLGASLRCLTTLRARVILIVTGGLICLAIVALAYTPFWAGLATFQNFGARGTLFTASPMAVVQALLQQLITEGPSQRVATTISLFLLIIGVLWSAWRGWSAPQELSRHFLGLLLWFLFVCNPWFQAWYLVWLVPLVALQPWRTRILWGVVTFCCTAMLAYLVSVFVQDSFPGSQNALIWNTVLSLVIYAPPLLVMLWKRWQLPH